MKFERDDAKRASNLRKHGLDFADAPLLLRGDCLYRPGQTVEAEERWIAIGVLRGRYVASVFTRRGDAVRVSPSGGREMARGERISRPSADELIARSLRGETQTDWTRVDAMTEEKLERSITDDPDWKDIPADWYRDAVTELPPPKALLSLRLDQDVVAFFRAQGRGYQTRMNAVLRAYMRAAQARGR